MVYLAAVLPQLAFSVDGDDLRIGLGGKFCRTSGRTKGSESIGVSTGAPSAIPWSILPKSALMCAYD